MKQTKGSRIVAILIDILAIAGVNVAAADKFPSYKIGTYDLSGQDFDVSFSLALLIVPLYFLIFDFFNQGRSAGKIVMGLKTVDENSQAQTSQSTAVIRTFAKCLSLLFWPISLIVFAASGKTLHDAIAKTVTISAKQ